MTNNVHRPQATLGPIIALPIDKRRKWAKLAIISRENLHRGVSIQTERIGRNSASYKSQRRKWSKYENTPIIFLSSRKITWSTSINLGHVSHSKHPYIPDISSPRIPSLALWRLCPITKRHESSRMHIALSAQSRLFGNVQENLHDIRQTSHHFK